MKLRDLEYIVAIDRFQHFGKAAEYCNVSQPALSSQVKKMEGLLGVSLFERNMNRIETTPAGRRVIDEAAGVILNIRKLEDAAAEYRDPISVPLKIGVIPTLAPYLVPYLCGKVHTCSAQISVVFRERMTHHLIDELRQRRVDIAGLSGPVDVNDTDFTPVFDEPLHIVLNRDDPLATQNVVAFDEVPLGRLILLEEGHCLRDDALSICKDRSLGKDLPSDLSATSLSTAIQYVANGFGVTLAPALAASEFEHAQSPVVFRRLDREDFVRRIGFLSRANCPRKFILNALISEIQSDLPSLVNTVH
jgi:LysR family hydrogen peroxide-inducible transcriptional activator